MIPGDALYRAKFSTNGFCAEGDLSCKDYLNLLKRGKRFKGEEGRKSTMLLFSTISLLDGLKHRLVCFFLGGKVHFSKFFHLLPWEAYHISIGLEVV